jgi:hypothetical protein
VEQRELLRQFRQQRRGARGQALRQAGHSRGQVVQDLRSGR